MRCVSLSLILCLPDLFARSRARALVHTYSRAHAAHSLHSFDARCITLAHATRPHFHTNVPILPQTGASANLNKLKGKVRAMKEQDAARLTDEYRRLCQGLQAAREADAADATMANPTLHPDVIAEAVPGNIRQAEHFVAFLDRFNEYLKVGGTCGV